MKRFLVAVAVLAAAGATYVAAASGGQQAAPTAKQLKALKKQLTALSHKVASQQAQIYSLNSQVSALVTDEEGVKTTANNDHAFITNCLVAGGVAGISEYGDPANGIGYLWQDSTGPSFTTALDLDSSSTPGAFFSLIAPACTSSGGMPHKAGTITERPRSTFRLKSR